MAVFAPGDSPPDDGSGQDPGMWARLMGYINPIGSANAAIAPQPTPNAAQGPGQDWARQRALADAQAQLRAGSPPNINNQPTLGPNNPIGSAANIPVNLPPAPPPAAPPPGPSGGGGGGGGGIGSDANFPVMGAGGFPTTYAPPGQQPPVPGGAPTAQAPMPPVRPKNLGQPVVRRTTPRTTIPASATASVPGSNPLFTPIAAQNQDWSGGALSRYGTNGFGRQGTALDLSQLFGRR